MIKFILLALTQILLIYSLAAATEEAPETSPSSPPLTTDDPGTPGESGIEINLITNCDNTDFMSSCEA